MHAKSSFFRSRDGRPQRRSNQLAPRSPQNGHSSPAPRNNSSSPSGLEEDLQDGTRLNKLIAASGYCSRRKADELIFAGAVQVNGVVERSPGRRILPDDLIQVEGQQLAALPASFSYIMLHKPIQVMCTAHDPQGRPTVLDCLTAEMRRNRVYPIGRLDYFSEGLLLLTNDGELAQRLMHPRHHQPKTYDVLVRGTVPAAALATMRRGMTLAEGEHLPLAGQWAYAVADGAASGGQPPDPPHVPGSWLDHPAPEAHPSRPPWPWRSSCGRVPFFVSRRDRCPAPGCGDPALIRGFDLESVLA